MKSINFFTDLLLLFIASDASAWIIKNATETLTGINMTIDKSEMENDGLASMPKSRRKRYISQGDMIAILDYHNQVRANVFPPAANMEYMLWDEGLARSAEAWAATCIWEHGPPYLLRYLGQNLSVRTGSYRSILQLVKPWYDEVRDYVFPYPRDCNPHCPMRCYGPMCTHYTQMVWASSNRVGCAIQTCYNMVVWGAVWREATYLVCNYSPKQRTDTTLDFVTESCGSMKCGHEDLFSGFVLLVTVQTVVSMVIPNATHLEAILEKYMDKDEAWWQSKSRGKRAISQSDMQLILDLHNKLRGQVYPPASNMEYMAWDTELERSAEHWAHTCLWEHGPSHLLTRIGQNLGAHWGRDRPPTFHVQAWYDEVRDFSYPYPQECNPHCPYRCSGPVCTHYTQVKPHSGFRYLHFVMIQAIKQL
ncbi:Peptidase inhibitor 15 [Labeo rohita]|uniref:Peptidase inhibitor 15 n=1 Tax=Labeo rohita TaxID=84645 RepID=A0ABQ8MXQ9_LABRO|nr:Peptidase inhibitor 15 [Labeo rohita]